MPFPGISWLKGNAECLPLQDDSFDAYTIAFGIRNTTHVDKVGSTLLRSYYLEILKIFYFSGKNHVYSFDKAHTPRGTFAKSLYFFFFRTLSSLYS